MKNILILGLFFFMSLSLFAQTTGLSYQAVIIGPDIQELPGVDAPGNILPNATVAVRFTIIDSNNSSEYQEVQTTSTDQYGRINLLIGSEDLDAFGNISWDGTTKDLYVEIDFNGGNNFVDMSREQLTFLPFAFHRNITATGTLDVDDDTFLNGELTVQLPTNLNSALNVNNDSPSNLTGDLTVGGATTIDGTTNLNSALDVNNKSTTNLTGALRVGESIAPFDAQAPTNLNGTLDVIGLTTLDDLASTGEAAFKNLRSTTLEVTDTSHLIGNTTIDGTTIINGVTTINNTTTVNGATLIDNTATITGATLMENTATVNGATVLNSTLDVKNKSTTNLTGTLNVGTNTNPFDASAPTNLYGSLEVNGNSDLNGPATTVTGTTNLNGATTTITGVTAINNTATITGPTSINNTATISGATTIGGVTTINNTATITGATTIGGATTINNTTTINGIANLNGTTNLNGAINLTPGVQQVKITSTNTGGLQNDKNSYPLLIEGAKQGIAIEVNGSRNKSNNFISFWDGSKMWGRIEGQTQNELEASAEYIEEKDIITYKTIDAGAKILVAGIEAAFGGARTVAASTSSTGCVGFGACVTVPIPSLIVVEAAGTVLKVAKALKYTNTAVQVYAQLDRFLAAKPDRIGITFVSGAGDYAEYLSKENNSDDFIPGELVGVKNGLVSKDVWGAEKIMVVSTRPIVLGNMPQLNNEENSVKIAFMGQVPVKVIGAVAPGDYILPNLLANGVARAVSPKEMKTRDYKRVAGVAWNIISENSGVTLVNIAVGINANDLSDVVHQQEEELKAVRAIAEELKTQMEASNTVLANLVPGYAEATSTSKTLDSNQEQKKAIVHDEEQNYGNVIDGTAYGNDIIEYEVPRELIEEGIELARETYLEALNNQSPINELIANAAGKSKSTKKAASTKALKQKELVPIDDHPFWKQLDSNPAYKEEIIQSLKSTLDKAYHTHKKHSKNFNEFKIRKN